MKQNQKVWTVGDMFCGAGGTTAGILDIPNTTVSWAINHDAHAIASHQANHPFTKHYHEDITDLDVSVLEPVDILWMSAECTHLSNAAGGTSRSADSRMLSDQIYRYAEHCKPKYLMIENVREFRSWGPLKIKTDENGRIVRVNRGPNKGKPVMCPDERFKGHYYNRWIYQLKRLGYENYRYKDLNAADFGAHTSRVRYFGLFSLKGYPIRFPAATHHKEAANGLKKWRPVKELLELDKEGNSIFDRNKPLADATMRRIAYGVQKYTLGFDTKFIAKYFGKGTNVSSVGSPLGSIPCRDVHSMVTVDKKQFLTEHFHGSMQNNSDIDKPCPVLMTKDLKQMITLKGDDQFLIKYEGQSKAHSLDKPLGALTTNEDNALASIQHITKYHGSGQQARSLDDPLDSLTCTNKNALTTTQFMSSNYGQGPKDKPRVKDLDSPCPTIPTTNKHSVVTTQFLSNQNYGTNPKKVSDIDKPCPTVTTQDRLQLITVRKINWLQNYFPPDWIEFLDSYIVDIKMRFLFTQELKEIQGFPKDYILEGTQKEQKKYIGNSVNPGCAKALVHANVNPEVQQEFKSKQIASA